MSQPKPIEDVSKWFYRGVWGVLTRWFRVPSDPPALPALAGVAAWTFRPDAGFLQYLKLQFWLGWMVFDLAVGTAWLVLIVAIPIIGALLTPVAILVLVAPAALSYLAIHLRCDTTWYVMNDRSLRIRRGIWIIHETTITFENVQNVAVDQGPVQRYFGIANVVVQTAGGGGGAPGQQGAAAMGAHHGLIEGVANAAEIRDLIMNRLKLSRSSGLGDEQFADTRAKTLAWSPAHLAALREIRDAAHRFAG